MVPCDPNAKVSASRAVSGSCTANRLCRNLQFSTTEKDVQIRRGSQHLVAAIAPLVKLGQGSPGSSVQTRSTLSKGSN